MEETSTPISGTRRRLLCGCAGGLLLSACGGGGDDNPLPATAAARGCLSLTASAAQATSAASCGLPAVSSGNPGQDSVFRNEFNVQANFWGIPGVSFAFLNDCNSPNALANPQDRSILFGISMAQKLLTQFGNSLPMWQVLAHEWGHQVQYALGDNWLNAPTVAPKELEADMFSGFYLVIAKNTSDLSSTIPAAFSFGDWDFNNPSHHGTPQQRGAAVVAGARVALLYVSGAIPQTYPAVRQSFAQELAFIL
jgi:hypothetical protein